MKNKLFITSITLSLLGTFIFSISTKNSINFDYDKNTNVNQKFKVSASSGVNIIFEKSDGYASHNTNINIPYTIGSNPEDYDKATLNILDPLNSLNNQFVYLSPLNSNGEISVKTNYF